jgi:hypothetical protein
LNPLDKGSEVSLANGNLDFGYTGGGSWALARSTIGVSSGKWYWEVTASTSSSFLGIASSSHTNTYVGGSSLGYGYWGVNGQKAANGGAGQSYGATYTSGDIIGVAFDADNWSITFYKNGTSQGTAFTSITSSTYFPATSVNAAGTGSLNTGARPFAYTAPSGFKALCSANLPAPLVTKPSTVMDVKLYTGNGGTQTISGLGFSPDLVWIKNRSGANSHGLFDVIRGATKQLNSNSTDAESTDVDKLTAFTSDGYSVGSSPGTNASSNSYVGWAWDAGSSTVTNTQGSISSQVRANASAGFSVVTWTGAGGSQTVGHGLGVTPAMIIAKNRSTTNSWAVWFAGFTANEYLLLNSTAAKSTFSTQWGSTPTSTVFGVADTSVNGSGNGIVAYCFAPVVGYSSFGSYTGNGSADGPFVYTGFRPRWIMIKSSSAGGGNYNWTIRDAARSASNLVQATLFPNLSNAEITSYGIDILSNGFKLRSTQDEHNVSSVTYIYAAFAESPFNYARAR